MQGRENALLNSCSPSVRNGLEILENHLSQADSYYPVDGLAFYLLNKVDSDLVSEFIDATQKENFWKGDICEYYQEISHICLLYSDWGLEWQDNEYLISEIDEATVVTQEGKVIFGRFPHGSALRLLSLLFPESERTELALSYFETHYEDFRIADMALGLLALSEFHSSEYAHVIENGLKILENEFEDEIGFSGDEYESIASISFVLLALVRLSDQFNPERAVRWLEEKQRENGSWGNGERTKVTVTAVALLVLFAAGKGPKTPQNPLEWESRRARLQGNAVPPVSTTACPDSDGFEGYLGRLRRISPGVLTGVITIEGIVILYLILTYNPAIFYSLPTLLMGVVTLIASLFTIALEWEDVTEMVQDRL